MSELTELVDNLRDSEGVVAYLSKAIEQRPDDEILRINAESVRKRQDDLVRRLDYLLHAKQAEFVQYRIIRAWAQSYPAAVVAKSLLTFQELVTAVFDSVKSRSPKMRYRPTPENLAFSSMEFAGASTGSVVISLAIDNDRLLVGQTELDRSFEYVERLLSARASDDIALIANEIGVAPITKAYAWAEVSASYGLDTHFAWGKRYAELHQVEISRSEAEVVRSLIENKSDDASSSVSLSGVMHGYDGATSYFHLETSDRQHIKGNIAPGVSKTCTTGRRYQVDLIRTSRLKYATGQEEETWTLSGFQPLDPIPSELNSNG